MDNAYLLIALFFCHFLADFTWLSTTWMLNAKSVGKPLLPIFAHAAVHAVLMAICLAFAHLTFALWLNLVCFQLLSHFLIDLWNGRMTVWFPQVKSPASKWHWCLFGFNQFLHAVVICIMYSTVCSC
jgi:hypothetical protein